MKKLTFVQKRAISRAQRAKREAELAARTGPRIQAGKILKAKKRE